MKRLFLIPLVILVVGALIFGGCAKQVPAPAPAPAPAPPQTPIKIGVLSPLTGTAAITGELLVRSVEFGLEEADYEVAGRKVEVIVEDSGGMKPDMAIDKARKLVEYDKVSMILGPLIGGEKLAVASYMSEAGIPHLPFGPTSWSSVAEQQWSFGVIGSEEALSYTMGRYAYDEMGLRTVTIMTTDSYPGHLFLDSFMDSFKKNGGQVVQEQYSPQPCPDFVPYLANLKDADAVVAWFEGPDSIAFLTQFLELGLRQKIPLVAAFHGVFLHYFILEALPPEVADAYIGVRCPTNYTSLLDTDVNKRFVEAFRKRYNYTPSDGEAVAYSATLVALKALEATGGDTTPEKLRQAILALDYEDPVGPLHFDPETRFANRNIYIFEVDKMGGEYVWVPIYTYENVPPLGE